MGACNSKLLCKSTINLLIVISNARNSSRSSVETAVESSMALLVCKCGSVPEPIAVARRATLALIIQASDINRMVQRINLMQYPAADGLLLGCVFIGLGLVCSAEPHQLINPRSEERRVGKECPV